MKLSLRIAGIAMAIGALSSCGYHVGSTTNLLPKTVQTIAIPAFTNISTVYKVTDMLSEAVTREFISRTKYHITADPGTADATLQGAVTQVSTFPTVYDPVTFRAANVEVHVNIRVRLVDRAGKVLFERTGMDVRERYEVSVDPKVYFDESEVAMSRLSRDVAKTIVSAVLENF
jgi:Lipopolysaccharide-assembly